MEDWVIWSEEHGGWRMHGAMGLHAVPARRRALP
jgi:hypothetical protein